MDTLPDLVWIKDPDGLYLGSNERFGQFFGAPEHDIVGKSDFDFVDAPLAEHFRKYDQRAAEKGSSITVEELVRFASDGHQELLETVKTPVFGDSGELIGVLGIGRDITERRRVEEQIRYLSQAVEQSPVLVVITDTEPKIQYVNRAFEVTSGYSEDEALGQNPNFLSAGETPATTYEELWSALRDGKSWEGELRNRKKNGELYWESAHIAPIVDASGETTHYLGIKVDVTEQKQQSEKILYQARFDQLTELPNRLASLERLAQMIAHDRRRGGLTAVLFVDLDDFKKVNDTLGHGTGDKLLNKTAGRLRDSLRTEDTVGRLGGDEFIVLLGGLELTSDAIAIHPDDGNSVGDLLRKADAAMYQAKNKGRADYSLFTSQLNVELQRRVTLEQQMIGALKRGEVAVFYQPQIDLRNGRTVSVEALLRWDSPKLGSISPVDFIPIAERNGMIDALGLFVLEEALQWVSRWRREIDPDFRVAVNLSPRQFRSRTLLEDIDGAIQRAGVPPQALELEITEGVLMLEHARVDETLGHLVERGISLSLDDFGTGYSSLSYLRNYPFDSLKIDRSFTSDITDDPADRELVVAIITMARSLELRIIAEGVETSEQETILKQFDCDLGQGYLYSRPVPPEHIGPEISS